MPGGLPTCCPKKELIKAPRERGGLNTPTCCPKKELAQGFWGCGGMRSYLFFGPRCACQASTSSSRAWKPLHTPHSTLVR